MTRRKFIQELLKAGSAIIVGACWVAKKASPRKFIRALKLQKYPGFIKPLQGLLRQGKWSG